MSSRNSAARIAAMTRRQLLVFVQNVPSQDTDNERTLPVLCDLYSSAGERISRQSISRTLPICPRLLEQEVSWAIQEYVKDPFQSHRAELAFKNLTEHGMFLSKRLDLPGCFRTCGITDLTNVDIQLNIVDCRTEGGRSSGLLRTIPWEILESPGISSIDSGTTVHVRRVFGGNPSSESRTIRKLTVLLVTSRFSDREDIPHRVVSLPLVSIVRQLDNKFVDVQLLRPGTWDAFREAVEQGSYDMVHLDVHGAVIDSPAGKSACLYFDGVAVAGEKVAQLLQKNQVRLVTLNACQSAFLQGGPQTNLAAMLLGGPVEAVVAMSHNVTPTAARIFLSCLYRSLLIDGQEMGSAVFNARRALEASKQRDSSFGFPVILNDYTVPLLFEASARGLYVKVPENDTTPQENKALSAIFTNGSVIGREQQILSLESRLIDSKVVVLTAFLGEGRATLLSHLKQWWLITNFVKGIFYMDFRHSPGFGLEQGEAPTAPAVCHRLHQFAAEDGEVIKQTGLTMDVLGQNRYLVVLENTDCLAPGRATIQTDLQSTLCDFASKFFDDDFASFLLVTSVSPVSWATRANPVRKAGVQTLELEVLDRMRVATRILGWSMKVNRGDLEFRYLHHIVQLCSSHTLTMQTLLPSLFANGLSARKAFWKLQVSPAHLDWKSDSLARIGDCFDAAYNEFGDFLSIFLPIHVCCSREYIQENIRRNLNYLPWAPEAEEDVEQRVSSACVHFLTRLRSYGVVQVGSISLAQEIRLHPLFCIYLRDRASTSRLDHSFRSFALYQHNRARRWAGDVKPLVVPSEYSFNHLAQFGALHFILQHDSLPESDRRTFDLPWIMASVYCGKVQDPLLEEEEIITDLALQALPRFVPGLQWTNNRSCNVLNIALLHGRHRIMPFQDCVLLLQLLQWTTLFCFNLSKSTARHANSYIVLLLEGLELLGESDPHSELLRFIRAVAGLTAAEIGAADLSWAVMDYGPVYNALGVNSFRLDPSRLLFLQNWDQDLRFRLNWLQVNHQGAIDNLQQWQPAGCLPEVALKERLSALNDVVAFVDAVNHLKSGDLEQFEKERSTLLGAMLVCSKRSELDRLLHTLYCLLRLSQEAKDWRACLEFLDRIEATELDLEAKPGFVDLDKDKYSAEAWRFGLHARCYRGLGDDHKHDECLQRSKLATVLADRLRTSWDKALQSEQVNRQRLLYTWVLDAERVQDHQTDASPTLLFSPPHMVNVPVPKEELEEDPDYFAPLIQGVEQLGGSGPMQRMPANPQPPNPSYIQRPFLVEARWLTVVRYLSLVTGREERHPTPLPEFKRVGTKFDLVLSMESKRGDIPAGDLRKHGFDVNNLTDLQFLQYLGLD